MNTAYLTKIVQLEEGETSEPTHELSIVKKSGGRLVTMILSKAGVFLREMEIYRSREPGAFIQRGRHISTLHWMKRTE